MKGRNKKTKENQLYCISTKDDVDERKVVELVAQGWADVRALEGKNIAAVFGVTTSGKSTTINALQFGPLPFSTDEDGLKHFTAPPGVPPEKVAEIGADFGGCTRTPKGFPLDGKNDIFLLDTRGFFDERNSNEMMASTILTKIALQHAKSVRIVFLQECESFYHGLAGMNPFGRKFGKFVNNDNIPALFLFNKFVAEIPIPKDDDGREITGAKRQEFIVEKLKGRWNRLLAEYGRQRDEIMKTVISREHSCLSAEKKKSIFDFLDEDDVLNLILGKEEKELPEEQGHLLEELVERIQNDALYQEKVSEMRYLRIMNKAFNCNAEDEESAEPSQKRRRVSQSLLEKPKNAGEQKSMIAFIDPCDEYSINELRKAITELPAFPVEQLNFSNYCYDLPHFFESLYKNLGRFSHLLLAQQLLQKYPDELIEEMLNQRCETLRHCEETLRTGIDMESLEKEFSDEDFSQRIKSLEEEEATLKSANDEIEKKIERIKLLPAQVIDEQTWCVTDYNPRCRVYVPINHPFSFTEEKECGTEPLPGGKTKPPAFDVVYANGGTVNKVVHVVAKAGKMLCSFGSIFFPFLKYGEDGCDKVDKFVLVTSKGKVTFSAFPRDMPENIQKCQDLKNCIDDNNRKIAEVRESKKRYMECVESKKKEVKKRVQALKNEAERDKKVLESFRRFKKAAVAPFEKYETVMKQHFDMVQCLYDERDQSAKAVVSEFMRLYQEFCNGTSAKVDSSSVQISDLDVSSLYEKLVSEFPHS